MFTSASLSESRFRLLGAFVALAVGAMSCGLFVSFDDYVTARSHRVQGTVDGLRGATVVLRERDTLIEVGDGPFSLPATVAGGLQYSVSVETNPAGHACTVERGSGTVTTHDVQDIAVHCPSTIATLSMLSLSAAALSPVFQPETLDYAAASGALGQRTTTVTARTSDELASISMNGATVASGQASAPFALATGPNPVSITVTAANGRTQRRYTIVVSAHEMTDYLKASNTQAEASFGIAMAVSGNTLVVGAPGESSDARGIDGAQTGTTAPGAGAVYVFTRTGLTWAQTAYLKASNTRAGAAFGSAVALSSDTLIVGAPNENGGATGINGDQSPRGDNVAVGAVYVFTRIGGVWSQQAYIKPYLLPAPQASEGRGFGRSLTFAGDTLVVGAPFDSSCGALPCEHAGAVYAFTRTGTSWSPQARIASPRALSLFGVSVALSGDRLAVGASGDSSNAKGINGDQNNASSLRSGAVYVFRRSGATWTEEAYLKASNTCPNPTDAGPWGVRSCADAAFGASVAFSGETLAVAAPGESSDARGVNGASQPPPAPWFSSAGAVYVFRRSATKWWQEAYVKAPNNGWMLGSGSPVQPQGAWTGGAHFGGPGIADLGPAIALEGDTLAVGAFYESGGGAGLRASRPPPNPVNGAAPPGSIPGAGAAYLFHRDGAVWSAREYVKAPRPRSSSWFGGAIALDPYATLYVGVEGDSSKATGVNGDPTDSLLHSAGAVYVY